MTQERVQATGNPSFSGLGYQSTNVDSTLARVKSTMDKVRVVHGVNEGYFDIDGKSVGSIRKSLREVFNIPGDASALIGGKEVGDEFIVEGNMTLEFVKEAGVKG